MYFPHHHSNLVLDTPFIHLHHPTSSTFPIDLILNTVSSPASAHTSTNPPKPFPLPTPAPTKHNTASSSPPKSTQPPSSPRYTLFKIPIADILAWLPAQHHQIATLCKTGVLEASLEWLIALSIRCAGGRFRGIVYSGLGGGGSWDEAWGCGEG